MKIDTNQIPDFQEKPPYNRLSSTRALSYNDADASLWVNHASLIDEAMQTPPADTDAVQRAQELVLSGQLESPENVRKAAEDITIFGI